MMIKKIMLTGLTVLFILAMQVSVGASELTGDGDSTQVPVRYSVDNTAFVITIPAVIVADIKETSFQVGASYVNLRPDQYIEVSITQGYEQDGKIILKRQNVPEGKDVAVLDTKMYVGGATITDGKNVVGYFRDGISSTDNLSGAVTVSPIIINKNTEAGDYQATLQFSVKLNNDENN